MRRNLRVVVAALLVGAACSSPAGTPVDAAPPDAFVGPATALFELSRGAPISEFYALPFPNDLRRKADGTLDLSDHQRPNPLIEQYLDIISSRFNGFGTNAAMFVRFSAPIDESTLPAAPDDFRQDAASVYLVDVTAGSPDFGVKWPMRRRFEHYAGSSIGTDWLSCLPYPGFPLRPLTTYALVVSSRLHATDGTPVARAADFTALIGDGAPDSAVMAARTVYQPLFDYLDQPGGDERTDVVDAAVFTTQDPTSEMGKIRDVIYRDVPAPTASHTTLWASYARSHDIWVGWYDAPNFQTGDPPYDTDGGEIVLDTAGDPVVQRMENIRMAVSVPNSVPMPPNGWPVVIYGHGTGGNYLSFNNDGTSSLFAAQGLAVISFDQVLHGPRNPAGTSPDVAFFNFQNPLAGRDNVRQGALDGYTIVRLIHTLQLGPHKFDTSKIYYMGHSQGGITGPPMLAYEPEIKAAVLSGAGGVIVLAFLNKTEPVNIPALVSAIVRDVPLDEFNDMLALVQMFMERSDTVNYARLMTKEPAPGIGAKDIYQSEGFVDHYTPDVSIEALGTALGVAPVNPILHPVDGFTLRGVQTLDAPVTNNLDGKTAVFLQYDQDPSSDGHFVVFDIPAAQRQHASFLGTEARDGHAILVP